MSPSVASFGAQTKLFKGQTAPLALDPSPSARHYASYVYVNHLGRFCSDEGTVSTKLGNALKDFNWLQLHETSVGTGDCTSLGTTLCCSTRIATHRSGRPCRPPTTRALSPAGRSAPAVVVGQQDAVAQ